MENKWKKGQKYLSFSFIDVLSWFETEQSLSNICVIEGYTPHWNQNNPTGLPTSDRHTEACIRYSSSYHSKHESITQEPGPQTFRWKSVMAAYFIPS